MNANREGSGKGCHGFGDIFFSFYPVNKRAVRGLIRSGTVLSIDVGKGGPNIVYFFLH